MRTFLGLSCAALLFTGCQKDDVPLNNNGGSSFKSGDRQNYRKITCVGCDDNGQNCQDCDCNGSGGNCLPDVLVTRLHQPTVDDVITAIRSGVQSDIKAAFSANSTVLANYLAGSDISAVISGAAVATTERGSHGERFIIIRDLQGAITAAYPLLEEE